VLSDADRLVLAAATGACYLHDDSLLQVLSHVARAGFDPTINVPASGLAGQIWEGRILTGQDRITSAARHYLRHVAIRQEWPDGTSFDAYLVGIRSIVLDPASGILTSRYRGQWQLTIVRRSGNMQGPGGFAWVLVEYRLGIGYWMTAYQARDGLRALFDPNREHRRWLRRPQQQTE